MVDIDCDFDFDCGIILWYACQVKDRQQNRNDVERISDVWWWCCVDIGVCKLWLLCRLLLYPFPIFVFVLMYLGTQLWRGLHWTRDIHCNSCCLDKKKIVTRFKRCRGSPLFGWPGALRKTVLIVLFSAVSHLFPARWCWGWGWGLGFANTKHDSIL